MITYAYYLCQCYYRIATSPRRFCPEGCFKLSWQPCAAVTQNCLFSSCFPPLFLRPGLTAQADQTIHETDFPEPVAQNISASVGQVSKWLGRTALKQFFCWIMAPPWHDHPTYLSNLTCSPNPDNLELAL